MCHKKGIERRMQVLGKLLLQGKEKEILLKEEDVFFKYYSLEVIGAYAPQLKDNKIVFKKGIEFSDEIKIQIVQLVNHQVTINMLQERTLFQIIGQVQIEGKPTEILVKNEGEIVKYYYLNLVGVYSPKIPGATIIFKQDTLENAISNDIKDNQQKISITPSEKEQIQQFLQKIKILDIVDRIQKQHRGLQERTQYNQSVRSNTVKTTQKQRQQQGKEKNQKEVIQKHQKQIEKVENKKNHINVKQEVDMDTRVTDMSNLEQVLQKNRKMPKLEHGDEPLKMGIVESDDLKDIKNEKGQKEQGHTSRYETVMITKQGKIKALDLDNDTQEGNNPLEKNYQVKQNETVKNSDVLTRLKVGEGTIGIEKGQYGEVEVYHSPRKTIGGNGIEGNKSLDRQLETSNAKNSLEGTNIESLKLAQEHNDGYRSVEQGYQEVEQHKKQQPECEPRKAKDLDGDKNTVSHTHDTEDFVELSSGEKVTYNELASRWGFYKDGKPDATYVKEKFTEKEQGDKKPEEVIEELDEEYEDPRTPEQRR